MWNLTAYFDGACEPVNPGGTAAYGAAIMRDGAVIWSCSRLFRPREGHEYETSNNVAEYSGFIAVLEELARRGWYEEAVTVYGDSMMVVRQMEGDWRIIQGHYVPLARKAKRLLRRFPRVRLEWIPREQNGIADELSKRELKGAGVQFRLQPE